MKIQNIEIEKLHQHPDNPRKNLGDVTELAESIRKNGIMQNLTVVPKENDNYTVIIGHRRLAAAKAAGIKEVPCIVSNMDERQQLCTMMEENMQRQDLTIMEQAYGFQFMLDLGEDIKSIAKRTGFGETTIRHRLEIAKLDRKTLEKNQDGGSCYQLGINELIELEKIKNIEKRNEILSSAYSQADLMSKINHAKEKECIDAAMEHMKPLLLQTGVKEAPKSLNDWQVGVSVVKRIDLEKKLPEKIKLEEKEGAKYFWQIDYYNCALKILEKAPKKEKEETEEDRQKAKLEQRKSKLCELEKAMYNTIDGWLRLIDETKVRLKEGINESYACARIWETFIRNGSTLYFYDIASFRLQKSTWMIEEKEKTECLEGLLMRKQSVQMIFMLQMAMKYKTELHDWEGKYKRKIAEDAKRVSDLLIELYGFRALPQELQQLLDGTHELYTKETE